MAQLQIDNTKCNSCKLCVSVCPTNALVDQDDSIVLETPSNCSSCGHCVAACPTKAITHPLVNSQQFQTIDNIKIDPETMGQFLASKRSIRQYKTDPIEADKLESILKAGACAPQAKNIRTQQFHVITDPQKIIEAEKAVVNTYRKLVKILTPPVRMLVNCVKPSLGATIKKGLPSMRKLVEKSDNGLSPIFHSAPCIIAIDGYKTGILAIDNASIAMQYMMLQAYSLGIDSCLIGYASARPKSLQKFLDLPKDRKVQVVAVFGYASQKFSSAIWRDLPTIKRY